MNIFITGASGYIGGSVAAKLLAQGHTVYGLARSAQRAAQVRQHGMIPVVGTLDDAERLASAAAGADLVINAASSDHLGAVQAMLAALAGSDKLFIHTSGSSIVGSRAGGELVHDVFDESTPFVPSAGRAARVALNDEVLAAAADGVRVVILCPSLIYGEGRGVHRESMQVPWLLQLAMKTGAVKHVGRGENRWSNVHIDDLVDLYSLVVEQSQTASSGPHGLYFVENGENSMLEVCRAIAGTMGLGGETLAMSATQAAEVWGDGPANNTMGSNSRVRALRARRELGWQPRGRSLIDELEHGYYARQIAAFRAASA